MSNIFTQLARIGTLPLASGTVDPSMGLLVINSADLLSHITLPLKISSVISIVCASGELTIDIDLQRYVLTPNTLMVLGPGHTIKGAKTSDDWRGFSIVASMKTLSAALPYLSRVVMCFLHYRSNPVIDITPEETQTQMMFHDLLERKMLQHDQYGDIVLRRLGEAVFYETLGIYSKHLVQFSTMGHRRSEELLFKFLQQVEKHFKEERSVSFYADLLAVTPKHLSTVIKECSGRTAGEWIDLYVILEAKILLSGSDKSIQQISAELNFSNQSFFGKYFKHHTGQSPRQYRNETLTV